jgi:hypothetical protein
MPKYQSEQVQMIGISHSGVRLIKRNRTKATNDTLQVLETFTFDLIQQISPLRSASTLEVRVGKKRLTIHSHRVNKWTVNVKVLFHSVRFVQIQKIKQIMEAFLNESRLEHPRRSRLSNHVSERIRQISVSNRQGFTW